MLISNTTWEKIRHQFSGEEKRCLNIAITGEAICPRGIIINQNALDVNLQIKLATAINKMKAPK